MIFNVLGSKKPDFKGGVAWINSKQLSLKELRGQVILVDFWTYSCINCIRTLPHLRDWHQKYKDHGLVIVGVQTPEFEFEKNKENVGRAVEGFGIRYPVVIDSKYKIWQAFENSVWPRKFLIDYKGKIRYDHSGEGGYNETEEMIQTLLTERAKLRLVRRSPEQRLKGEGGESDLKLKLPKIDKISHNHRFGQVCYPQSLETYCGYGRGVCLNERGFRRKNSANYADSGNLGEKIGLNLQGKWYAGNEYLRHAAESNSYHDYLRLFVKGVEVNGVCEAEKPTRVEVKFGGQFIKPSMVGEDLKFAPNGQSYFEVANPRMYRVLASRAYFAGNLQLYVKSDDFKIFALTFGGCTK